MGMMSSSSSSSPLSSCTSLPPAAAAPPSSLRPRFCANAVPLAATASIAACTAALQTRTGVAVWIKKIPIFWD